MTVRLVKRGPQLPAIIYRPCPIDFETWTPVDRHYHLRALIDGKPANVDKLWESGMYVTEKVYRYWQRVRAHIKYWEPHGGEADPRKAIDFMRVKPRVQT